MAKQKTFWAGVSAPHYIRHLWNRADFPDFMLKSACGLRRNDKAVSTHNGLWRKCKSCKRALAK